MSMDDIELSGKKFKKTGNAKTRSQNIRGSLKRSPGFFRMGNFIDSTLMKL